ncbi:hypothetical protein ADL03_31035, partial [Nocardia sp. NRRL S-836]
MSAGTGSQATNAAATPDRGRAEAAPDNQAAHPTSPNAALRATTPSQGRAATAADQAARPTSPAPRTTTSAQGCAASAPADQTTHPTSPSAPRATTPSQTRAAPAPDQETRPTSPTTDPRATIATTRVRGTKAQRADALHDLSVAHVELGHLDEAAKLARRGLRLTGEPRFRLALAWIDLDRGRLSQSLEHLNLATPQLRGRELVRARCLRGLHLCRSADPRAAMAELTAVIRELRRYDDQRWLANALIGRGIARCQALRLAEADADFTAAEVGVGGLPAPPAFGPARLA